MTFDNGGISGHINHRAVSAGIKYVNGLPLGFFLFHSLFIIAGVINLVDGY